MSLDGLLLEKLASWRPEGRQTLEVTAPDIGWSADITADAVDVVGCRLWELTIHRSGSLLPPAELKERADSVAARVTGLLEPLRLIEVDASRGVALLRSSPPGRRDHTVAYYELLLHADGDASMRRFEGPHGDETRRCQIDFAFTHECLGKLVTDLVA